MTIRSSVCARQVATTTTMAEAKRTTPAATPPAAARAEAAAAAVIPPVGLVQFLALIATILTRAETAGTIATIRPSGEIHPEPSRPMKLARELHGTASVRDLLRYCQLVETNADYERRTRSSEDVDAPDVDGLRPAVLAAVIVALLEFVLLFRAWVVASQKKVVGANILFFFLGVLPWFGIVASARRRLWGASGHHLLAQSSQQRDSSSPTTTTGRLS